MATKATLIFVLIFSLSVLPGLVENLQCYSCANCQIKSPRLLPAVTCSTEQQFCVKMRFYFIDFMMSHHCAYSCEEFATSTFSVNCCTTDMCNHGNRTNIGPALLLNLLLNLFISFLFWNLSKNSTALCHHTFVLAWLSMKKKTTTTKLLSFSPVYRFGAVLLLLLLVVGGGGGLLN